MLFYYIGIGGNSIAFPFSLACLFICLWGNSVYKGVTCFACIKIASTLASSLACDCLLFLSLLVCFLFCLLFRNRVWVYDASPLCLCLAFAFPLCLLSALFLRHVYAIVFAPCSGNAERQKQHHGQSIAERRQGERLRRARLACLLPLLSVHNISLCAGLLAGGYTTARPGVLFRYGLTRAKSQIRLAHPPNLLFRDKKQVRGKEKTTAGNIYDQEITRA